jgi:hypothetical protein
MSKHVAHFNVHEPMQELSRDELTGRSTYAEQVLGPPLHYRLFDMGAIARVTYPEQRDPGSCAEFHGRTYQGIPFSVTSSPARTDRTRWRHWYFDSTGSLLGVEEHVFGLDGPDYTVHHLDEHGRTTSSMEYVHGVDGRLQAVVYYDAEGRETGRDDGVGA